VVLVPAIKLGMIILRSKKKIDGRGVRRGGVADAISRAIQTELMPAP